MLTLRQSDTAAVLILTLTELATTASPDYYFVFTHTATREAVTFTRLNSEDESLFTARYNKFTIDPSALFDGMPVGEWHYKVYENDADGAVLERGKMILSAGEFTYQKYNSENSFKTYNG